MPPIPDLYYIRQTQRSLIQKSAERERVAHDTPKVDKVSHVKSQGQTRDHHCHWPGCDKQVPPAMWGCRKHWMALPRKLRDKIWAAYRPGQEVNMTPSMEYLRVAREVRDWIVQQFPMMYDRHHLGDHDVGK